MLHWKCFPRCQCRPIRSLLKTGGFMALMPCGPLIGSFGVIRWSAKAGHIGVVANYDRKTGMVTLLGCNQKNRIGYDSFHIRHFIAFRVPPSEEGKIYAPFAGTRPSSGYGATR